SSPALSLYVVTPAAVVAICVKPLFALVLRSIRKPVSFVELSVQRKSIRRLTDDAVALRLLGAAGATPVSRYDVVSAATVAVSLNPRSLPVLRSRRNAVSFVELSVQRSVMLLEEFTVSASPEGGLGAGGGGASVVTVKTLE